MPRKATVALLLWAGLVACEISKSPTGPTNPGEKPLPPTVIPPGVEVYESPEGAYIRSSAGRFILPPGCLKVEVREISPGRGSVIIMGKDVALQLVLSVCSEYPEAPIIGREVSVGFGIANQSGEKITDWFGGARPVLAGQTSSVRHATRVYEVPPNALVPSCIYGMRVRWTWGRGVDQILDSDGTELRRVIPLKWHREGATCEW